jgi:hypothetical protein
MNTDLHKGESREGRNAVNVAAHCRDLLRSDFGETYAGPETGGERNARMILYKHILIPAIKSRVESTHMRICRESRWYLASVCGPLLLSTQLNI